MLVGCIGLAIAMNPAASQKSQPQAKLVVSSVLPIGPGSETKLEISVGTGETIPPRSVLILRGVPPGIRLSTGRSFGAGVWVLPVTQPASVTLQASEDATSGGIITISLATLEGVSLAEAQTMLVIVPASKQGAARPTKGNNGATASAADTQERVASIPRPTPEALAELTLLLKKGDQSFRLGDILIARQFYLRAAEGGLAAAAFALATTYDPRELAKVKGAADVTPDTELARKWYEKARELGSPDAAARLAGLLGR